MRKRIPQVLTVFLCFLGMIGGNAAAMNKAELVEAMASKSGLSKADAKKALDGFLNSTEEALWRGDRISLIGFGAFSISKRAARTEACRSESEVHFTPAATFIHSEEEVLEDGVDSKPCPEQRVLRDNDILADIQKRTALRMPPLAALYNALLDTIIDTVNAGEEVSIEDFGDFYVATEISVHVQGFDTIDNAPEEKERGRGRTGRNPQTGKEIQIAARGLNENELRRLTQHATRIAADGNNNSRSKQANRANQTPGGFNDPDDDGDGLGDCDDPVCVTTKNKVKFKAGAELSGRVN